MAKSSMARVAQGNGHIHRASTAPGFVGRDVLCRHAWSKVNRALALSPKESEIVLRLFDDLTEADIAEELGLSQHTVHSHLKRLYQKVDVASRVQLVIHILAEFVRPCEKSRCSIPRRGIP